MNLNIDKLIKAVIPFFILMTIAYLVGTLILFMLPQKSVEHTPNGTQKIQKRNYDMSAFFNEVIVSSSGKKQSAKVEKLTNVQLIAVYAMSNADGWVTIKDTKSQKTHTLQRGESFKGYKLKEVFLNQALFERNGIEYKIQMPQEKKKFEIIKLDNKNKQSKNWKEKIVLEGNSVQIKRRFFDLHIKDFEASWKASKSKLIKKGSITGYKLLKIEKDGILESLGLKQNDIIKRINNINLNNYEQAFGLYKNIKDDKKLVIEIYRDNRLVELTYEIN